MLIVREKSYSVRRAGDHYSKIGTSPNCLSIAYVSCFFFCHLPYSSSSAVKSRPLSNKTLSTDLMWNRDLNFVYCPNAKTGTSTWMQNFLAVSHLPQRLKEKLLKEHNLHHTMKWLTNMPGTYTGTTPRHMYTRHF